MRTQRDNRRHRKRIGDEKRCRRHNNQELNREKRAKDRMMQTASAQAIATAMFAMLKNNFQQCRTRIRPPDALDHHRSAAHQKGFWQAQIG